MRIDMKTLFFIGSLGQWIGGIVSAFGIGYEWASGADLGYVLITAGSVLFAIFTKVKYWKGR
jgi:hypothetical protein